MKFNSKTYLSYCFQLALAGILICFHATLRAQDGIRIKLPEPLSNNDYEYSGLGIYKSKLILLQQYPTNSIPGIDTSYIGARLNGDSSAKATIHYWQLRHLDLIKHKLPFYQGFEAVTVVGNEIFLSIETLDEDPDCYVIKGMISDTEIILDTSQILPLRKPRKESGDSTITIHNIGFESMAWMPGQNKLLLLFEYNRYPKLSHGYMVNKELTSSKKIKVSPIDFRITDIYNTGTKTYGINYYYSGEYDLFNPIEKIKKDSGFADWKKDCFSRIVEIEIRKKKVNFKVVRDISFENDNWEGIMYFRNGVLMITDKHPESKLEYFPF